MRATMKGPQQNQISRMSIVYQQNSEMTDLLEAKYLQMIQELLGQQKDLGEGDRRALEALTEEYKKNKNLLN